MGDGWERFEVGGHFTSEEKKRITAGIRDKYARVSVSPEDLFSYPTGRAGLEALGYGEEIVRALPEVAVSSYCGVGNPFSLGPLQEGEAVLDIGCGGGVDTLAASIMVGFNGKAVGMDSTPNMLARARRALEETRFQNVFFLAASGEELPFRDDTFHAVISNGVFNLIPDKARALREVLKVLRPGGRFMVADQVLTGELPKEKGARVERWAQ